MSLSYTFDGFHSCDDFIVLEMNYALDCILGIPWLARYQPQIDWLARSVMRRQDFDVSVVLTRLLVASRVWPHVRVVDWASTTHVVCRASDGPLCTTYAVLLTSEDKGEHARRHARERHTRALLREARMQNEAVEQRLPHENEAVEQRLPQINEAVEQRLPHVHEAVEQRLPQMYEAVEQRHQHATGAVEQRLPHDDVAVGTVPPPRVICAVENELSRLEEGASSSSESDTSVSSRGSRRTKTSRRSLRRLKPRRNASPSPDPTESVCTIETAFGDLKAGDIEQVCLITDAESVPRVINSIELSDASSRPKSAELKSVREERFAAQSWEALKASGNPVYETACEFADVFPDKIPAVLPADRGVPHGIDLAPGANTSPHSSPTFCVKKATGGWFIVHAFNKLNDATIPAQTPIPRKDMVLESMSGSVIFSAIDLTDVFYQILMRESDIPLTAVSTPSGMLWEWLVMPQGLKNAPTTFNRMVSQVLHPLRDFAPSYFDAIFVHSRAEDGLSAVEVHIRHLRQVFQVMRENKLYANLKKCVFGVPGIPVPGCYVSKNGVRADPEKVLSICSWPTPTTPTELRQWLGLANYLHKYTKEYAGLIQPSSSLLKKDATCLTTLCVTLVTSLLGARSCNLTMKAMSES
ncbi:unnamed protein product [Phytophthora fragariaefolia]|uniref:Unnamed protein product n=1 Tax=Phytophthora fragariaefolia TaxID=1490495 RepID=A0A9W7D310_9STRA|nr:unnamed protein product [Phytophthora fragariaefolia]